jgi:hypothetical protein
MRFEYKLTVDYANHIEDMKYNIKEDAVKFFDFVNDKCQSKRFSLEMKFKHSSSSDS